MAALAEQIAFVDQSGFVLVPTIVANHSELTSNVDTIHDDH